MSKFEEVSKKQAEALGNLGMLFTDDQILEQHYDGWEGEYECLNAFSFEKMERIVKDGYVVGNY